jgi:methylaspartate mutase epsilon subunit
MDTQHHRGITPLYAAGLDSTRWHASNEPEKPFRIAIIGSGPRGLAVFERLAAQLSATPASAPVDIYLIDAVQVGCGRVWSTRQSDCFLMNTVAGEVTLFSGRRDEKPARAGAGPSLAEWWNTVDPQGYPGPNGYAPRSLYGRYLSFVASSIEANLPSHARLHRVEAMVEDLEPIANYFRLILSNGLWLQAHQVVIATGHAKTQWDKQQTALAQFAASRPHLRYIEGDSPAEMPLEAIPAGDTVGVIGLGLSFYDVLAALTVGRGGQFDRGEDGSLSYRPSGREPRIVAGSRGGMLMLARGINQKSPEHSYKPHLFTFANVSRHRPHGALDFKQDVLPWLMAEVELTYYATALRRRGENPDRLIDESRTQAVAGVPDVAHLASYWALDDLPRIDLEKLGRPFAGRTFDTAEAFDAALLDAIHTDVAQAKEGNVGHPLKAALDIMRDVRGVIRQCVDFGGLNTASYRDDFLDWFVPLHSFLVAGPPLLRLQQAAALIQCGLLRIVGPEVSCAADEQRDRFVMRSPRVLGSDIEAKTLLDARIPAPDLQRDTSPLMRRMVERGVVSGYVRAADDGDFHTGGVRITRSPYHPIRQDGTTCTGIYILGIPSEHTRWFMQIGNARPGNWGEFIRDADAIATGVMTGLADHGRHGVRPHIVPNELREELVA